MLLHSTPYIYVNLFNFSYHVGAFYSRRVDSRVARLVARVSRFRVCVVDTLVDMRVASLVLRVSRLPAELVDIVHIRDCTLSAREVASLVLRVSRLPVCVVYTLGHL